jgi:segregation and condensation protein B
MSQSTEAMMPVSAEEDDFAEIEVAETPEPDVPLIALEDPVQQKRVIEAILFASPEPVSLRSLQNRLPESADVGALLLELQAEYAERGVNLIRLEDVWAFRSAVDLGTHLALNKKEEKKLSRAALETLSIIAYHQPLTRAEIENIRGVATSKGTLDVLLEAGWIKPGRRLETPGRPLTWITTNVFLDEFGISDLKDLPGLAELKATGLLDTRPAIDTIPGAADLFGANENKPASAEDAEGEEEEQADAEDGYIPPEVEADASESEAADEGEATSEPVTAAAQDESDEDEDDSDDDEDSDDDDYEGDDEDDDESDDDDDEDEDDK